ncbi:hypothetical protein H6G33_09660 [Calothrix sp. FACHB-1219]|uniref:hypothetical protein n=1 Tax=unclassified Calothrix TaxID=2619626 RepID=UPI0016832E62|nr:MULTISPECIES: hypothetical protein [unclassified Calothrix]MBD2201613.1 hypothetical protein [Calothrix sp. FACHB-168]MBD2217299.1 hypothetical protein [Calothrix sp. FACHB-1219]
MRRVTPPLFLFSFVDISATQQGEKMFQRLFELIANAGLIVRLNNIDCHYNYMSRSINIKPEQIVDMSKGCLLSKVEVEFYTTLHEFGHSLQPVEMIDKAHMTGNFYPLEEDAWNRAEEVYKENWGNPPEEFYMFRDYSLDTYK